MPAPAVRRAGHGDREELARLWRDLVGHHEPIDSQYALSPGAEGAWREHVRRLVQRGDGAVFVCGESGALEGFCSVERTRAAPPLREPGRAEITDLFVVSGARRSGVGRALVEAALAWVRERKIDRVEVRVATANRDGQAFWRALGWGDFVDVLQRRL